MGISRVVEAVGNFGDERGCLAGIKPAAGRPLGEIRTVDEIADDVDAVAVAADFVHADDAGVA